jgi:hypothetical protein
MIKEQDLIDLGFEWDDDHFAHALLVRKSPPDEMVESETYVLVGVSDMAYICKKWTADLDDDVIRIGKLDLDDLKDLIKILKRAL